MGNSNKRKKREKKIKAKKSFKKESEQGNHFSGPQDIPDQAIIQMLSNIICPVYEEPPKEAIRILSFFKKSNTPLTNMVWDLYAHIYLKKEWKYTPNEITKFIPFLCRNERTDILNILLGISLQNDLELLGSYRLGPQHEHDEHNLSLSAVSLFANKATSWGSSLNEVMLPVLLCIVTKSNDELIKNITHLKNEMGEICQSIFGDADGKKLSRMIVRICKLKKLSLKVNSKLLGEFDKCLKGLYITPSEEHIAKSFYLFIKRILLLKVKEKKSLLEWNYEFPSLMENIFSCNPLTFIQGQKLLTTLSSMTRQVHDLKKVGNFLEEQVDTSSMPFDDLLKLEILKIKVYKKLATLIPNRISLADNNACTEQFKRVFELIDCEIDSHKNKQESLKKVKNRLLDYYVQFANESLTFSSNIDFTEKLLEEGSWKSDFGLNLIAFLGHYLSKNIKKLNDFSRRLSTKGPLSHYKAYVLVNLLPFFTEDRSATREVSKYFYLNLTGPQQLEFYLLFEDSHFKGYFDTTFCSLSNFKKSKLTATLKTIYKHLPLPETGTNSQLDRTDLLTFHHYFSHHIHGQKEKMNCNLNDLSFIKYSIALALQTSSTSNFYELLIDFIAEVGLSLTDARQWLSFLQMINKKILHTLHFDILDKTKKIFESDDLINEKNKSLILQTLLDLNPHLTHSKIYKKLKKKITKNNFTHHSEDTYQPGLF